MEFEISQKAYDDYHAGKETIVNERLRPAEKDFFDVLMEEDLNGTPEGVRILKEVEALG